MAHLLKGFGAWALNNSSNLCEHVYGLEKIVTSHVCLRLSPTDVQWVTALQIRGAMEIYNRQK